HFKPNKEDFEILWSKSIFAFDANILLNLYRYSEITKDELLKVMSSLSDRLWLPYQATEEYFRNRISTTGGQIIEYEKVNKTLNELINNLG
ncbi:PIN-like domain-containing protein, partial [Klebsiella pneumoniae]|uniref:PIN-like domain-containing protein n=1 Tax=Klebsiella pneumoniae TaxID=573 RepID=UPI0038525436